MEFALRMIPGGAGGSVAGLSGGQRLQEVALGGEAARDVREHLRSGRRR